MVVFHLYRPRRLLLHRRRHLFPLRLLLLVAFSPPRFAPLFPAHPPLVTAMTIYMPMPRAQDAPCFTPDPYGFDSFFEDVVELGARCQLTDAAMIKWEIRYAGPEAESWHCVPCLARARAPAFAEFLEEVREHYPDLAADCRYTRRDLDGLLERTRDYKEMSLKDLGEYYRKYLTCSAYLVNNGILSERDRCNSYLRGFPQPVLVEIRKRLAIKRPDGYIFDNVH